MMIKNTNTNTTRRQIRDTFRYAEKYGLESKLDETLADQIRGVRFQDSGITEDLFRLWDSGNLREKALVERVFTILTDRSFEAFADDVYTRISEQAEEQMYSALPPRPFPGLVHEL